MKRKKRILAILLTGALGLSACGITHTPPSGIIHTQATITAGSERCRAAVDSDEDSLTITLLSPAPLEGMSWRFNDGSLTMTYNGMSCTAPDDYLPADAFQRRLYRLLQSLGDAVYTGSENGEDRYTTDGAVICCKKGAVASIEWSDVAFVFEDQQD